MSEAKFFPRRLSFPRICDVLVAYLNAGADKEFVGLSDVVAKSNVTLHNISRNNNFLKSWRFIEEKEGTGKYRLGREAAEFAYAYKIDPNGQQTKEILRRILSADDALAKFVERIREERMGREKVLIELPRLIGDLRSDKVGLNAFLDMMAYAFNLDEIERVQEIGTGETVTKKGKMVRLVRGAHRTLAMARLPTSETSISININITPEISPEKLKEYVRAVLEALKSGEE
ncbi:MAG: hypothetical protein RMJ07_04185 [Nitrososphaerota archaeon]|nr:hypothetical protein [Candidatus Bathyarchaeota archaeon]MDW8048863.1 hypothetical protein [Nitrososphaerota archaeon]